jgi:hypothetical protein
VEEVLSEAPDEDDGQVSTIEASSSKLFEEIKVMFQDLPSRIERVVLEEPPRSMRARLRRLHPGMVEELVVMTGRGERGPGLAALVVASFFRDDFPWLFQMAAEAYHLSMVGEVDAERRAVMSFMRACDMTIHGPLGHEPRLNREAHMMLRELPMLLERFMAPVEDSVDPEE